MATIRWVKPNDKTIVTNDLESTIEYANSLGWKLYEPPKVAPKPTIKKTRSKKVKK